MSNGNCTEILHVDEMKNKNDLVDFIGPEIQQEELDLDSKQQEEFR